MCMRVILYLCYFYFRIWRESLWRISGFNYWDIFEGDDLYRFGGVFRWTDGGLISYRFG